MNLSKFIALIAVVLFASTGFADAIRTGYHPVGLCEKIINLDEFPEIVVLGFREGVTIDGFEVELIENNACLTGYKFNSLKLYAFEKSYIDSQDLNEFTPSNDSHALISGFEISVYGGEVPDSNPLVKKEIEYVLVKDGDEFSLFKEKETETYSDGTSKSAMYDFDSREMICTKDAKVCDDGSTVGRNPGLNCEFDACPEDESGVCTDDAKICPDGTAMGRNPDTCEFDPCPGNSNTKPSPSPAPVPAPQKNFLEAIICFFTSLFGGKC